ncbi:hypothetical protein DRN87_02380 [Candidatus Geothermarchaeota archaeon]|nr:MAG: hypothetical protein DRN87_02380 [Candidatus Geothermarchaeota archaeon]
MHRVSLRNIWIFLSYEGRRIVFSDRFRIISVFILLFPTAYIALVLSNPTVSIENLFYHMMNSMIIILYLYNVAIASNLYYKDYEENTIDYIYSQPVSKFEIYLGRISSILLLNLIGIIILALYSGSSLYILGRLDVNVIPAIAYLIILYYVSVVYGIFIGLLNLFIVNTRKTVVVGILIYIILFYINGYIDILYYSDVDSIIKFIIDLLPHRVSLLPASAIEYLYGVSIGYNMPTPSNLVISSIIYLLVGLYLGYRRIVLYDPI